MIFTSAVVRAVGHAQTGCWCFNSDGACCQRPRFWKPWYCISGNTSATNKKQRHGRATATKQLQFALVNQTVFITGGVQCVVHFNCTYHRIVFGSTSAHLHNCLLLKRKDHCCTLFCRFSLQRNGRRLLDNTVHLSGLSLRTLLLIAPPVLCVLM